MNSEKTLNGGASQLVLKIVVGTSIVAFLLLNNFHCWFSSLSDQLWCFETGFGGPMNMGKYFAELAFGSFLLLWLIIKPIDRMVFAYAYVGLTVFVIVAASQWLGRISLFSYQWIYLFYLLIFLFYIVRFRKNFVPKTS